MKVRSLSAWACGVLTAAWIAPAPRAAASAPPLSVPAELPAVWALPAEIKTVEPALALVLPMRGSYDQHRDALRRLRRYATEAGIRRTGPPFGRYLSDAGLTDEAENVWELGYPVEQAVRVDPPFEIREYPATLVASLVVRAPHADATRSLPTLYQWMAMEGYTAAGASVLIWSGDPRLGGDEGPWTELRVPVERVFVAGLLLRSLVCAWGAYVLLLFALLYVREAYRRRLSHWGGALWSAFGLCCALFYLGPLLGDVVYLYGAHWQTALRDSSGALSALVLPLLVHLCYRLAPRFMARWWPRLIIPAAYVLGVLLAVCLFLELYPGRTIERIINGILALGAACGLAIAAFAPPIDQRAASRVARRVYVMLLCLTLAICAVGALWLEWAEGTVGVVAPRALPILILFAVTYFNERALFFDVLVKRGIFAFVALVALGGYFVVVPPLLWTVRQGWVGFWLFPVSILPLAVAGPWFHARLGAFLDRRWLGRRHTPADAQRLLVAGLGGATTETGLVAAAEQRLKEVFQAEVRIVLVPPAAIDTPDRETRRLHVAQVASHAEVLGVVTVDATLSHRPFLSEDQKLLEALAQTLALAIENLRLREREIEQLRRAQELQLNASRSELKALRSQINPHFLFNTLNSIAALIGREPARAEATVERLAEVFRYTLRRADNEWVRVEDEMAFVRCYLEVEATRFGDRLEVAVRGDDDVGDALVPAMSIQTLVENAIKHGVAPQRRAGRVEVVLARCASELHVSVRDSGPGFPHDGDDGRASAGHGLRNVRDRLAGHFGAAARLVVAREEPMTVVRIELPYLLAAPSVMQEAG